MDRGRSQVYLGQRGMWECGYVVVVEVGCDVDAGLVVLWRGRGAGVTRCSAMLPPV